MLSSSQVYRVSGIRLVWRGPVHAGKSEPLEVYDRTDFPKETSSARIMRCIGHK
jgi:hypothetical protein